MNKIKRVLQKRRVQISLLITAIVIAVTLPPGRATNSTAICITLLGPKMIPNAEFSVSKGQITVRSGRSPITFILPVDACMIVVENSND